MARYSRYSSSSRYSQWPAYVPVAVKRARAEASLKKMTKTGHQAAPVRLSGHAIVNTFWGKAWCENLERYSDFENRLPRGRSYVRNGSVVDLQIEKGKVVAMVAGSSLYRIEIKIKPLSSEKWDGVKQACAGQVGSLIELLQGRLSAEVMKVITAPKEGLFPHPHEIDLDCSCPDWADMCKHVAASLYGVGARLDEKPELLFLLRGVDHLELLATAVGGVAAQVDTAAAGMAESEMADVFGIEIAASAPAAAAEVVKAKTKTARPAPAKAKTVPRPAAVRTERTGKTLRTEGTKKTAGKTGRKIAAPARKAVPVKAATAKKAAPPAAKVKNKPVSALKKAIRKK